VRCACCCCYILLRRLQRRLLLVSSSPSHVSASLAVLHLHRALSLPLLAALSVTLRVHRWNCTVAVIGDVDSGKSTLIGVLATGSLDNGAGMKRLEVCRHMHEIEHGRTSSISQQVLGTCCAAAAPL
jgi:GTPase